MCPAAAPVDKSGHPAKLRTVLINLCLIAAAFAGSASGGNRAPETAREERGPLAEPKRSDGVAAELAPVIRAQKAKLPRIESLIKILNPRSGTNILDIGAGTGQSSYLFAERLKGSGSVYATEIDPRLVEYIAAQAKQRKLDNLSAALVKPDGLDPFYLQHRYDLVLLYDVNKWIRDRPRYYRELAKSLNRGARVAIVQSDVPLDRSFHPEDFLDWKGFVGRLAGEPLDSPFGAQLRQPLQALLAKSDPEDPYLRRMALFHLNRLLDSSFFRQFASKDGLEFGKDLEFTPEERSYALWIWLHLQVEGYSMPRHSEESRLGLFRLAQLLNKLVVIEHFRRYLVAGDGVS